MVAIYGPFMSRHIIRGFFVCNAFKDSLFKKKKSRSFKRERTKCDK